MMMIIIIIIIRKKKKKYELEPIEPNFMVPTGRTCHKTDTWPIWGVRNQHYQVAFQPNLLVRLN